MEKGANDWIAEMPERPARAAFQNSLTPMPMGDTTPNPVITTRVGTEHLLSLDEKQAFTYRKV
jgi:hypothetical protein